MQVARLQAEGDAMLAKQQAAAQEWEATAAAERARLAEKVRQLQV